MSIIIYCKTCTKNNTTPNCQPMK